MLATYRAPNLIIQRKAILFDNVLPRVTDFYLEIEVYLFKLAQADIGLKCKIFLALENENWLHLLINLWYSYDSSNSTINLTEMNLHYMVAINVVAMKNKR